MDSVIHFNNVSKLYRLGASNRSLRETLSRLIPWKRATGDAKKQEFWALNDVSFEIDRGEILGVFGPNGAGKTTILKLASHVTYPSSGRINVKGRISSLIELGAGFHPDLTGRENVYLNGVILGLKKREIDRLFDQIVEFAGVTQFIDTPVKRFSSGMYARLGFSVAVHVNPEILLVDEVLSVGDRSFQVKCIERMKQICKSGTTIIFVSHNMRAIGGLCNKGLFLNKGQIQYLGPVRQALQEYQNFLFDEGNRSWDSMNEPNSQKLASTSSPVAELSADLYNSNGELCRDFSVGEKLVAQIHYSTKSPIPRPLFSAEIVRADGVNCCTNTSQGQYEPEYIEGSGMVELTVPDLNLLPGTYTLGGLIWDQEMLKDYVHDYLVTFRIHSKQIYPEDVYGIFLPDFHWRPLSGQGNS
jgi:lipopolysaccharide transport system ATP-binding protein